jgi:hypothetical protein
MNYTDYVVDCKMPNGVEYYTVYVDGVENVFSDYLQALYFVSDVKKGILP